jgi:YVTN family beta-propeller protein
MPRPHRHTPQPLWRGVALATGLLCVALLASVSTAAAQQFSNPGGPTVTESPRKAYVGLFKDNAVAVIDTVGNRVLSTIPIPPGPHGLTITPDGRKVYVSSDGASTVSVIDTTTDQVVASIDVGPHPHGLTMSPDGRKLLVMAFGANQVSIIDTTSDRMVGHIPVPLAHNGAVSADGRTAYVGSQLQGATALMVLDLVNMTQVGKIALDKPPRGLDLSPDGTQLYFTVAGVDAVLVLDTARQQIIGHIATGASPHLAVFAPHGQLALSVDQGPGELGMITSASHTVSGTVKVSKAPHWRAVSSDGSRAYVTNEGSNDVSVVDLAKRQVVASIAVGNAPRKIAVQPGKIGAAAAPAGQSAGGPAKQGTLTFSDHGIRAVQGIAAIELAAEDYYFAPTFLQGEPGQTLTLAIENASAALHNLSIPALHVDKDIPPKGKVHVQVTFPQSGTVSFFCKLHAAMGMRGELLAGDATPAAASMSATPKTPAIPGK